MTTNTNNSQYTSQNSLTRFTDCYLKALVRYAPRKDPSPLGPADKVKRMCKLLTTFGIEGCTIKVKDQTRIENSINCDGKVIKVKAEPNAILQDAEGQTRVIINFASLLNLNFKDPKRILEMITDPQILDTHLQRLMGNMVIGSCAYGIVLDSQNAFLMDVNTVDHAGNQLDLKNSEPIISTSFPPNESSMQYASDNYGAMFMSQAIIRGKRRTEKMKKSNIDEWFIKKRKIRPMSRFDPNSGSARTRSGLEMWKEVGVVPI